MPGKYFYMYCIEIKVFRSLMLRSDSTGTNKFQSSGSDNEFYLLVSMLT
jgi:hypothetical protein